jgi:hypothetical protein
LGGLSVATKIYQNWGYGAPASGLPSNYFGVRWTVTRNFGSGGPFSFRVESRDGIRVHLDGVRKVNIWKNSRPRRRRPSTSPSLPASTRCVSTSSR